MILRQNRIVLFFFAAMLVGHFSYALSAKRQEEETKNNAEAQINKIQSKLMTFTEKNANIIMAEFDSQKKCQAYLENKDHKGLEFIDQYGKFEITDSKSIDYVKLYYERSNKNLNVVQDVIETSFKHEVSWSVSVCKTECQPAHQSCFSRIGIKYQIGSRKSIKTAAYCETIKDHIYIQPNNCLGGPFATNRTWRDLLNNLVKK